MLPTSPSPSTSSSPCSSEEGGFAPHSTHNHQQQHTASTQQPPTATVDFGFVNQLNSTVVNLAGLRQEGFAPGLGAANTNSSSTNSSNSISSGTNHIQLMSQMVHGLTPEGVKLEAGSSSSTADAKPFAQDTSSLDYQSAAAAAVFQQHNFVYYNNPFCGTSAPAWPYGVAGTPHWSTFNANNKKAGKRVQLCQQKTER
uniref:Uncharacterized protein n=1 Tax=Ditylenchus dipsaci TaxID=166011 RepID=A0A915EDM7_9BILA